MLPAVTRGCQATQFIHDYMRETFNSSSLPKERKKPPKTHWKLARRRRRRRSTTTLLLLLKKTNKLTNVKRPKILRLATRG